MGPICATGGSHPCNVWLFAVKMSCTCFIASGSQDLFALRWSRSAPVTYVPTTELVRMPCCLTCASAPLDGQVENLKSTAISQGMHFKALILNHNAGVHSVGIWDGRLLPYAITSLVHRMSTFQSLSHHVDKCMVH